MEVWWTALGLVYACGTEAEELNSSAESSWTSNKYAKGTLDIIQISPAKANNLRGDYFIS